MKRGIQFSSCIGLTALILFSNFSNVLAQEATSETPSTDTPVFELGGQAQDIVNDIAQDTPENAAKIYMDAMRRSDWKETARLMHPEALAKLKEMFKPIMASPEHRIYGDTFLGVKNVTEFAKLSGAQTWENLLRTMTKSSPALKSTLQTSQYEIIGHVEETPTISHVVYRMKSSAYGINLTKISVMTFKRHQNSWRGLLSGDLENIASAISNLGKTASRKP